MIRLKWRPSYKTWSKAVDAGAIPEIYAYLRTIEKIMNERLGI